MSFQRVCERALPLFCVVVCTLLLSNCISTPSGRRAFIITSESQEARLGTQAYHDILKKERLSRNRKWNAILQRVGRRIAAVANKPDYKWEFKLIDSEQQNAFALPGGKVAFYTGILSVCQNEAGLAVVMGHEVAHATARHGGQRLSRSLVTQLGFAGLSAVLGGENSPKKSAIMAALGVGLTVGIQLPYSRASESEADEIGLVYMARAGYDPREASRFWGRFAKKSGSPPEFLSTHPSSRKRSDALHAQLARVMPVYSQSPKYGLGEKL